MRPNSEAPRVQARTYSVRLTVLRAAWGKMFGRNGGRVRLVALALLASVSVGAGVVSASQKATGHHALSRAPTLVRPGLSKAPTRPNIVFVLTDDLSMNLLRFMPHVQAMMRRGMSFDNYFVTDSLCCPSRASIFTGNFPHDTRIFGNAGRQGGFHL